jgi:peptidoglycan-associated lipoprotein
MTKKKLLWAGLAVLVLFLSVAFLAGCAKKASLKEEAAVTRGQGPVVQAPMRAATDDQAAREKAQREQALREQALREQALRDQAAKDAAAKAAKEASERDRRGVAEKQAAILGELQIRDIYFDFDKYNLKSEDQAVLKAAAPAYLKYGNYNLVIEGNCDERGTVEYNLALGQKRADVAAKYLIDLGIAKERIKTISYGKERPLDSGHNESAWAKNRRDHFVTVQPIR